MNVDVSRVFRFLFLFVLGQMDFSRRDPILRGLNEFLPRLMPTREYGEFVRACRSFPPGRQLRALSYKYGVAGGVSYLRTHCCGLEGARKKTACHCCDGRAVV